MEKIKVRILARRTFDSTYGWMEKGDIVRAKYDDAARWEKRGIAVILDQKEDKKDGRKTEQRNTKRQTAEKELVIQDKEVEETEEIDLDEMTTKELRSFGKELKIKNYHNMSIENLKDRIVKATEV